MLSTSSKNRVMSLSLLVGPCASLAVSPSSNFDPINLIKLLFVTAFAFSILALLVSSGLRDIFKLNPLLMITFLGFTIWMIVILIVSDSPFSQQLYGVFGRNTGFFTYFSLGIVTIGASLIQTATFNRNLVWTLLATSVPMMIYAVIQIAGRDPIGWSEMAPFATLGNINFSSAFFGLAALCAVVLSLSQNTSPLIKILLIALASTQMLIVLETGSIQGIMIFFAGLGVAGFLWLRSKSKIRALQVAYILSGGAAFTGVAAALFNVGPFARFIFQSSVLFRFDYWHAGWEMTLRNPLFGVGLDSYGDWYRETRGEISTLRTGPDRITNTAHNIYLDLSASGGFTLLALYAMFLVLAIRSSMRVIRRSSKFDPVFAAIFSAWIAYLIQAAVSINQVGVGIWGWLFTGALIGYERSTVQPESKKAMGKANSSTIKAQLPAGAALFSIAAFAVGFLVAFVPFNADSNFKDALQTGDVTAQFEAAKKFGATAYHMELALDAAIKADNEALATEISNELIQRYPRDFMAWRVRQVLPTSTQEQRQDAYAMLKMMDPFNPDIQPIR